MENFTVNRDKKTFVFDDGEELPIPKDKVKQVLRSPAAQKSKQESVEKWKQFSETVPLGDTGHSFVNNLSESTFGNLGDTAANYAVSGYKAFTPGEGQEEMGYIDRLLDHFYAMQEGRKEHLAGQTEKSPNAALAGQIGGMGLELGTLHGVPAAAALPIMGAGHSETSFLEPSEKLPEVGQEVLTGYLLDKFFGAAGKVAGHRQTRRGIQNAIRTTEEGNAAEVQRALAATKAEGSRFASESAAREAEISRLPQLQQVENQAFVNSSAQRVDRVARTLGKTPIAAEAMGVEPFIADMIDSSVFAGTKEGKQASNFLRTLFKGNAEGKLTGEAIQKGMKAVDEMIIRQGGEMGNILTQFRSFVTQELPGKLGNYYAYEKWVPKIQARLLPAIENDLLSAFKHSNEVYRDVQGQLGKGFLQDLNTSLKGDIHEIFRNHAGNFEFAIADGTIANEIKASIEANPLYQAVVDDVMEYGTIVSKNPQFKGTYSRPVIPEGYQKIREDILSYPERIAEKVTSTSEKYLPDIKVDIGTKSGVTQGSLNKLPQGPNILPEPPPVNPAQTFQPNLAPVPQIPEPQGVMQRLAYGLEGMGETGLGGMMQGVKDNATTGLLAKMAGVPLGKIAAAGAGLATGLSALTSPSVAGAIGRSALEQTARMMSAVHQRAEQYPSHSGNGILQNPMERRSLVREIEDDINMRIEDKAIIQSKINRGQPLIPDVKQNQARQQSQNNKY